jgi:hypothetical protein
MGAPPFFGNNCLPLGAPTVPYMRGGLYNGGGGGYTSWTPASIILPGNIGLIPGDKFKVEVSGSQAVSYYSNNIGGLDLNISFDWTYRFTVGNPGCLGLCAPGPVTMIISAFSVSPATATGTFSVKDYSGTVVDSGTATMSAPDNPSLTQVFLGADGTNFQVGWNAYIIPISAISGQGTTVTQTDNGPETSSYLWEYGSPLLWLGFYGLGGAPNCDSLTSATWASASGTGTLFGTPLNWVSCTPSGSVPDYFGNPCGTYTNTLNSVTITDDGQ